LRIAFLQLTRDVSPIASRAEILANGRQQSRTTAEILEIFCYFPDRNGIDRLCRKSTSAQGVPMAEKSETDITGAQWVRALALARGLDRAHALFPAAVAAAVARGTSSLGPQPAKFSAVTEPAVAFDPAEFGDGSGEPT